MDNFSVRIQNRVITTSEEIGKLLVFLDDEGNIPSFYLENNIPVDEQIQNYLQEYFYANDLRLILNTKQFSCIHNQNNELSIVYNFLAYSTFSKRGSFVHFNNKSIELFRMANNKSI